MIVEIEIFSGPSHSQPTKQDIQKNIDALKRAIDGKPKSNDFILMNDTISILRGIQDQLPDGVIYYDD